EGGPRLALPADVLTLVGADRAGIGRRRTLGELGAAGLADVCIHAATVRSPLAPLKVQDVRGLPDQTLWVRCRPWSSSSIRRPGAGRPPPCTRSCARRPGRGGGPTATGSRRAASWPPSSASRATRSPPCTGGSSPRATSRDAPAGAHMCPSPPSRSAGADAPLLSGLCRYRPTARSPSRHHRMAPTC